jgi:hypothetical protein
VVVCAVGGSARGGSTFFDDWAGEVGQGPDSAWGAFNANDPNNPAVEYTNVTPAQATASNPSTIQVISDPTAQYGQALQMTLLPNPSGDGTYLSSEISTQFDPSGAGNNIQYGQIQASIRLPGGSNSGAVWPAFWMLGDSISSVGWPNCGEIDIMENNGALPGVNYGTIHGPNSDGSVYSVGSTYTLPSNQSFYNSYHTFTIDWSPDSISFLVDGNLYYTATPASLPPGATWEFDGQPFYLILDVNEGGFFAPGTITTPQVMDVAYVSVTVPEPAALSLLALGILSLLARRCRPNFLRPLKPI